MSASWKAKTLLGKYEVQRKLGQGGMGQVLLAKSRGAQGFSRDVAIKQVRTDRMHDRDFLEILIHEARVCAQLQHPNIVEVYDLVQGDKTDLFIVMEYVKGQTLETLIYNREGPVESEEAIGIMKGLLSALGYAHSRGIIHRDIKPANILVKDDGLVKLMDFGLAKSFGLPEAPPHEPQTRHGQAKGTPCYMSPEQIRGQRDLDGRSDLFSLGAVFWELLCQDRLFDGLSDASLARSVQSEEIVSPGVLNNQYPEWMDTLVLKMLQRDPSARFQSAKDALQFIDDHFVHGAEQHEQQWIPVAESVPVSMSSLDQAAARAPKESKEEQLHHPRQGRRFALSPAGWVTVGMSVAAFVFAAAFALLNPKRLPKAKPPKPIADVQAISKAVRVEQTDKPSPKDYEAPMRAVSKKPILKPKKRRWRPRLQFSQTRFEQSTNERQALDILWKLRGTIRGCFFDLYPSEQSYDGRIMVVYLRLETTGERTINVNSRLQHSSDEFIGGPGYKMAACIQRGLDKLSESPGPPHRMLGALDVQVQVPNKEKAR